MATCIDDGSLEVNDEGKLEVKICGDPADEVFPGAPCSRNLLKSDPACGLHVRERRPMLRRAFRALGGTAVASTVGPRIDRALNTYQTQVDTGSALGLWTIQGDGSILINCAGVYLVSNQTTVEGTSGRVIGGRARVTDSSVAAVVQIIASQEWRDITGGTGVNPGQKVQLGEANDGPEFNASAVRNLLVGATLVPINTTYMGAVGQQINWRGEFTLTYLGEGA